jgi:FAD/FMN-containing dehydrogenase
MEAAVNVRTRDGGTVELDERLVDAFKGQLRGALLAPADAGYEAARSIWNAMIDRRPALIARCLGVADVVAGVRFAREQEHTDLFWDLSGGGGNFGVVTSIEYELHPVGPEIVGGAIAWPADDAPLVTELYQVLTAEAPPELTIVFGLRKAPPAPWLHPSIHGQDIVALFVCHSGDLDKGERLVKPIKALGSPVGDIVQRRSYVSQQSLLDATQPNGRRYYWKSEYLREHDPAFFEAAWQHARRAPSPHSAILSFPLSGALNRLPVGHSPMGNRDAHAVLNVAGSWEKAEDDAANVAWVRDSWQELRRFSTGGTYVNFLTEEEGTDRIRAAYGANYEQLARVKAAWDPANLFRTNKNIAPAGV